MDAQSTSARPVRAGVFSSLPVADTLVQRLLAAGFSRDEITVVCSDEALESHFRQFEHQDPAGSATPSAVVPGATIGAAIGGLAGIAVGAASGTVPLLIAGAAGLSGGSAMGGFLGAMLTRGEEKELANFYDQAVRSGKILVGVEAHGPHAETRLAQAAKIIADAGAEPVSLPEG
ncbi:MAG: hypothetical protein ACM3U2_11920 [Deltaproteobacteria bacterium]